MSVNACVTDRVHSSNTQISINGNPLVGVSQFDFSADRDATDLRSFASLDIESRISQKAPKTNITLGWTLGSEFLLDPFLDLASEPIVSVENFVISQKDNVGENIFSGCYLTSYEINAGVGELVKGALQYEGDYYSTGASTATQTSHSNLHPYLPSKIKISSSFSEGQNTGASIQSFSFSLPIPRKPIYRIGERTPQTRYPEFPVVGDLSFSILKTEIEGITGAIILPSGDINITLEDCRGFQAEYSLKNCSYISFSESLGLDDNATLDFNYKFNSFTRE